jgi:hypothetical protein
LTEQRWYPGTLVVLTLQREDFAESDPDRSVTVNAKVVRSDAGGVGFLFVMPDEPGRLAARNGIPAGADKKRLDRFLRGLPVNRG